MSRQSKVVEAVTLVIDVGQAVNQQDVNGNSFLSRAKVCASRIIQRKIFSASLDQFSLILIGSEKTENELNHPHVEIKHKYLTSPSWKMLKQIENLTPTDVNNGDWLDGLVSALNLLKSESDCKKFTDLKIVMISNLGAPTKSKDQVDDIIRAMKDLGIKLVVIGPTCDDENESENFPNKTDVQRKGEALLSRIVDEVGGVMCGFDDAMEQLQHSQKVPVKAMPWNCDLQIGEDIFIPISAFKKFSEKKVFGFKKRSSENRAITQETVYFHGDNQVDRSDIISGYLFGETVIPVAEDDKASMALSTEKCFKIIGFTKRANVPRHIMLGMSAYYVTAKSENQSASTAVTALAKALQELEMVAIIRKVYLNNTAPQIGALIPSSEQDSYFFYYVQLPFAEDERFTRLPSLRKVQPSKEQLDAVDEFIDSMDLTDLDEDEDPYCKLANPAKEHENNLIAHKALHPDLPLPSEPADEVKRLLQPLPEFLENASQALELIKQLFPLEEIEQKTYRKGAADVFNRNSRSRDGEDNNTVQAEVKSENMAQTMASFIQSAVTEVGTINPEGNFLKLLEQGEPFNKICEQMQTAIRKLFLTSSSVVGVRKPLSALALLRTHCVKQSPTVYNTFVASLKDDLVERNKNDVWNQVAQDKLGLITSSESEESTVTSDDAEIFYEIKKCESQSENYEMEAEDLLDLL